MFIDVLFHVDPLYGPVAGGTLLIFSWTSKEPRVNVTGVFVGNSFVPVVAINARFVCVVNFIFISSVLFISIPIFAGRLFLDIELN